MKTFARLATFGIAALALSTAATGCFRQTDDDVQLAEDAAALSTEGSRGTGLGRAILSPIQAGDAEDATKAAEAVETKGVAGFYPPGCVAVTRSGVEAHVQFDDCTGPFGLVHLSGGIDAVFTLADGALHADLEDSGDLTVQGEPSDYRAATNITFGDGVFDLDWTASWSGTTAVGAPFTHSSDLDIAVDPATECVVLSGTAEGSVEERGLDSVIEGYAVCPAVCPSAGRIESTGKTSGATVVVEFDGSAEATVTWPSGRVTEVGLVCAAAE